MVPLLPIFGILRIFKMITFRLEIRFSQHALSEFCTFFPETRVFFHAYFFLICYYQNPPQFLLETKRFAFIEDSSALCDLLETSIFLKFSSFERFSVEQNGENGFRVLCVCAFGVFFVTVEFMKFQQKCPFVYLKNYFFDP